MVGCPPYGEQVAISFEPKLNIIIVDTRGGVKEAYIFIFPEGKHSAKIANIHIISGRNMQKWGEKAYILGKIVEGE